MSTVTPEPCVLSAGTLIGDDVCDPAGERIGTLKELMLDTAHGRIMYAVLSVGGVFGLGDRLFAVPWDAVRLDTENKCLILSADKERLEEAPGFDKDDWPDFADPRFNEGTYAHFRIQPYWLDQMLMDQMADESPAFCGEDSSAPGGLEERPT